MFVCLSFSSFLSRHVPLQQNPFYDPMQLQTLKLNKEPDRSVLMEGRELHVTTFRPWLLSHMYL